MDTMVLQNRVTVSGGSTLTVLPQSAIYWLDIGDCEDVTFALDVSEVTGTVTMNYETSVSLESASFVACVTPFLVTTGVRSDVVLAAYAPVPVARYLRWRITTNGMSAWDITFRVWLSL